MSKHTADERTERALRSAARWLKRRGAKRESRETKRAYATAASIIMNRATKR